MVRKVLLTLILFLALAAPARAQDAGAPPPKAVVIRIAGDLNQNDMLHVMAAETEAANNGARRVVIVLDSDGGSVQIAQYIVAIIDQADEMDIATDCVVDGHALSASFYILQTCRQRYMTRRSILMAHQPKSSIEGDTKENVAGFQLAAERALAEGSAERLKCGVDGYMEHVKKGREWWMHWQAALEAGAVDGVVRRPRDVWEK